MNMLENWASKGVISIDMSQVASKEAQKGSNKKRTDKAREHILTHTHASTPEEQRKLKRIQEIVFPNGITNENQSNDCEIIFNADKYGCILITNDGASKKQPGGILGNAERLKNELNIRVMSDVEAVEEVIRCVQIRDSQCREIARAFNLKLPFWVGKD
jgi:hypothetical protein